LAYAYNNIASVFYYLGDLEEAHEILTKCLNIMKLHWGENNIKLAHFYNNISSLF
jgi:hypothetical protein